ncbi:hypothetical protein BHE74_00039851 [Ensete ventricosum]|nr:hypothetical protein BHE74_00039851 [Ensete ventricosum]
MAKPRTISFSEPDGISSRKQKPHFPRKRNTICSLVVNSSSPRQIQPKLDQIPSESAKTNPSQNPTSQGGIAVKGQPFGSVIASKSPQIRGTRCLLQGSKNPEADCSWFLPADWGDGSPLALKLWQTNKTTT